MSGPSSLAMNKMLTVALVVLAGLAGLAFVFTDVLIVPPGPGRVALAAAFYLTIGFVISRLQADGAPVRWALACGWGTAILGLVGLWLSISGSASGDLVLALIFLLGPAGAAALGAVAGGKRRSTA